MWNDKPDGYPIPARNPMGTGTGTNFYPRVRVQISTRNIFADGWVIALPDPLPFLGVSGLQGSDKYSCVNLSLSTIFSRYSELWQPTFSVSS
jgi:hypothetical protein